MSECVPKEGSVEAHLVRRVKALGGKCLKFESPGTAGVCDRLILLPFGVSAFVETKRLGEEPDDLQAKFIRESKALGHNAFWASTVRQVDQIIYELMLEVDMLSAFDNEPDFGEELH